MIHKLIPFILLSGLIIASVLSSCNVTGYNSSPYKSALSRQDQRGYYTSYRSQLQIRDSVLPCAETIPVDAPNVADDAADDIAIWVNKIEPEKSLLIGSNKKGGVVVYDLNGNEIGKYNTGRINNIDILYQFPIGKDTYDIVGCTNRTDQSVDLYLINPISGQLTDIAANELKVNPKILKDVYGFCFYNSTKTQKSYAFVSGKNGTVEQFELTLDANNKINLHSTRTLHFKSQTEGLVADEELGFLYVGEEDHGIWKIGADPDTSTLCTLLPDSGEKNTNIKYDLEGLTIYKKEDGTGYLIASSQGNFSYAVFKREGSNEYLGSFKITETQLIDGVEETDGLQAVSTKLGDTYPQGILVVQDGYNYYGDKLQRQNFKIVDFQSILSIILKWKTE